MSIFSGLVAVALLATAFVSALLVALRMFHRRRFRASQIQSATKRRFYIDQNTIRRYRLLASLDTMLARSELLMDSLSRTGARPTNSVLAGGKPRRRKPR